MALALESLTFSVETKELENAIQKIKELGQAASSLNKPIEQLSKQASEAGKKVEKVAQAADNLASSAEKSKASTRSFGKSTEDLGEDTDVVASKIERLTKQLSFLRNDQQLSTTGFTKSQAAMMAWADVAGATSDQIRVMAQIQDDFNKIMGEQALDKSVAGLNMMNRQLREFSIVQELAAKGVNLTSTQVKQLSRDMEVLRQQNEALGRNSEAGIDELKSNFTQAASEVNRLTAASKAQQKAAEEQASSVIRLTAAQSSLIQKENDLVFVTQKVQEGFSKTVAGGMLQFSKLLQQSGIEASKASEMLNKYASDLQKLEQLGKNATKAESDSVSIGYMDEAVIAFRNRQAKAIDDLVKAEQSLVDQEQRLQFVTQKTSEGFTVASANSLYRYEQSLKKAGVTEQEFINRSSAYATALKARQDVSDTNTRRKAATEELIRIEKQLEDQEKFLAYATAEFSKQQQQAAAGNQNFADSLSMGSLRALFAYEQALRRAGVAEIDVASKSEVMRKQMLQMQQATESFNGSVNHLGRNVGVQFTDIFVSLYNGQPIMQVITQQGGQLADAFLLAGVSGQNMSQHLVDGFKKILESYKMLGAAFAGLAKAGFDKVIDTFAISTTYLKDSFVELMNTAKTANSMNEVLAVGFNKLTVAVTALGRATALLTGTLGLIAAVEVYKSVKAYDDLTTSLIRFGGAILGGVDGARQYANELQELGWSAGKASEYITAVAKSGNLSEDQMRNLAAAAKDMDTWLNVSFEDTVKLHSEIKKAPVEAVVKLAKETGLVSSAVLDNIIKYEQAGETQKAVMAAMNEAIRVHGEQVNSAKKNYSDFAVFIIEIGESIKKAYNSIFSYIFEKTSPESALKEQVKTLEERLANPNMFDKLDIALGGENRKNLEETLKLSKQELDVLVKQREEQEKKSKAEYTRNKNAGVNADVQSKALAEINRADAKKMSQQEYINAVLKEQNRLYGENVLDAKSLSLIQQQAAKDWKKANESQAKQSQAKPKTSFSTSVGNTIVETSRQFEQRLQLEQRLTQDQLATLENYYKDGLNSKGNYLAQEVNIVTASREKQLQILEQYNDAELAAFAEKEAKLRANAAIAIAKGGDTKAINKQLQQNLADLAMQKQTFNEKITGKQELAYSAVTKILSKSLSEVSKSTHEVTNDVEKFSLELEKQQVSRQAEIQFAAETIGMSEKEIAVLKAKMQVQEQYNKLLLDTAKNIAESESTFWEFVQGIDPMNSEALDKAWAMWQGIQKAKMKLTEAGAEQELAQRIAMQDAALAHDLANYKKLKDGVADAIATALFEGGEEGKKKLRDLIVAELRKPIKLFIDAVVNAGLQSTGFGQGTAGSALGAVNFVDSVSKAYSTFTGGLTTSLASAAVGIGEVIGSSAAVEFGMGMKVAAFGGETAGLSGAASAGASFGAAMPWIAGGLALVSSWDSLFGRKLKDQGLEGTFGGADGFDGNSYEFYKGGLFRSNKTKRKALDSGVEDALEAQFKALQTQTALMAQTLGLSADSVADFTTKIKVSFKGLSEEQISERMTEEFGKIAESMARGAIGTTEYARTGETAVETMTRLYSSLTTVNGAFDALGQTLYASTLSGADMASQLVDLMGGLENFTATTASYYENFYTEAERTEVATRQLTDALASIGVDTVPATREAFRSLVKAQDLTSESGRKTYAALLGLSAAFAALVPVVETIEQAYQRLTNVTFTAEQAAEQRIRLEEQLLQLQGNTAALRERELAALDPTNRALQKSIWALEDLQDEAKAMEQAVQDAITAQQDYTSAVQSTQDALTSAQNALVQATDAVTSVQNQATSAYLNAKDREAAAIQQIADLQTQTQRDLADAVRQSNQELQDMADTLREFVFGEMKDPSRQFGDALAKALAGDKAAMASLPDLARSATEAATLQAGSAVEARRAQAEIMRGVLDAAAVAETAIAVVPDAPEQEDPLVAAQRDLTAAQMEVADALRVANAIQAPLTQSIEDLIAAYNTAKADEAAAAAEVQAAQAALDAIKAHTWETWQATKALDLEIEKMHVRAQLNVSAIVDTVINAELPPELEVLALGSKDALQKTIDATITSTGLTPELKLLALESTDEITKVVAASIETRGELGDDVYKFLNLQATDLSKVLTTVLENSGNLSTDVIEFVSWTASDVSKTLTAAIANKGVLGYDAVTLIGLASDGITKTLQAAITNSGALSTDAKTLIAGSSASLARTLAVTISNPVTDKNVTALLATTSSAISRTIETTIKQAGATPTDITNLKLGTTEALTKNISTVLTNPVYASNVPEAMKQLLAAENIAKNLLPKISTDNLTADQVNLLNSIVSSTTKDINLAGSVSMSTGLESLLGGILEYTKQTSDNTALQYFAANPDVAKAYSQNTYGKTIGEFAKYHYQNYGINEGRLWGGLGAASTSTGTIAAPPSIPAPPVVTPPPAPVAAYDKSKVLDLRESTIDYALSIPGFTASGYLSKNPDVASGWDGLAWEHKDSFGGRKDLYAAWHYAVYGKAEQRLFANGGYTGPGGKYEPAGIVHAGEVVFSQRDIASLGGVGVVEGIRTGEIPLFANGGIVQSSSSVSTVLKPDNSELVEELRTLREEVKMLRAEARATAINTGKSTRILDDVTQGGTELRTKETVAA